MFDAIGEGHKIMHEGVTKEIDLDELEKLAAQATPGPWTLEKNHTAYDAWGDSVFSTEQTHNLDNNAAYILAACNSVPHLVKALKDFIYKDVARYFPEQDKRIRELEAENRELRKKVQEMDRQMVWLAKQVCDSLSPQEWINRAEKAIKEADNA